MWRLKIGGFVSQHLIQIETFLEKGQMTKKILVIGAVLVLGLAAQGLAAASASAAGGGAKSVWLDSLDVSKAQILSTTAPRGGQSAPARIAAQANKSIDGNDLMINATKYERGVAMNAPSEFDIDLRGGATHFTAIVGVDDESRRAQPAAGARRGGRGGRMMPARFIVMGDKKVLWQSGPTQAGNEPNKLDINLAGVQKLRLISEGSNAHADWAMAKIEYSGNDAPVATEVAAAPVVQKYITTPKEAPEPKLTGPKIFGVRPGNPFLFTVTATGERPMEFGAKGLPAGLKLDPKTGQITGKIEKDGKFTVKLTAKNARGTAERDFRIVAGPTIALTPPMGWNSWNCWGGSVSDAKVRASAKAMVDTGLINHGWSYINIDDSWMRSPAGRQARDPNLAGPPRDANGEILTNGKFPDMKALTDYIHGLGLKAGIYIGPGPTTCQGLEASWQHEQQDAKKFGEWGFDYLKYDWCGYSSIAPRDPNLEWLKKPYILMRQCLDQVHRDIVYSLCQYGWGNVWTWGEEVGGNSWRTTGDIGDSWRSMSTLGFGESDHAQYAKPGHWNDPDMLVLGKVGWGPNLRDCSLTADEQYTHISMWCLVCSPLLIGCPIEMLDEFTLNLLTNDEVLEVSQDPLGQGARRIARNGDTEVWAKSMEDGSMSVGLFNRFDYAPQTVTVKLADLKINSSAAVRDLWRQKDLGTFKGEFSTEVPVHGVVLIRVTPK
jgi:alpha-galactosidase